MAGTVTGVEPIPSLTHTSDTQSALTVEVLANTLGSAASMSAVPSSKDRMNSIHVDLGSTDNQELLEDDQVHQTDGLADQHEDKDEEAGGASHAHEKLHEDDRRQQPRWKTVLYKVLPFLENVEELRRVTANSPLENSQYKYVVSCCVVPQHSIKL